jgi:hypothetical protein
MGQKCMLTGTMADLLIGCKQPALPAGQVRKLGVDLLYGFVFTHGFSGWCPFALLARFLQGGPCPCVIRAL